jgi:penicillin-binding protein 2
MSAGGRAVRKLAAAGDARQHGRAVDRHQAAEADRALFGDRRGALVAIDPKTGEMLAFVSKPTFDPNLFVDGIDSENWKELNESPDKPLLNRALRGTYPPGSTYKPFMALAALEPASARRSTDQRPRLSGSATTASATTRKAATASVDMYKSIVQSCDTYYYIARQRPWAST